METMCVDSLKPAYTASRIRALTTLYPKRSPFALTGLVQCTDADVAFISDTEILGGRLGTKSIKQTHG